MYIYVVINKYINDEQNERTLQKKNNVNYTQCVHKAEANLYKTYKSIPSIQSHLHQV